MSLKVNNQNKSSREEVKDNFEEISHKTLLTKKWKIRKCKNLQRRF
jgi:hypothetical protein